MQESHKRKRQTCTHTMCVGDFCGKGEVFDNMKGTNIIHRGFPLPAMFSSQNEVSGNVAVGVTALKRCDELPMSALSI